jgi:hypothetical protein
MGPRLNYRELTHYSGHPLSWPSPIQPVKLTDAVIRLSLNVPREKYIFEFVFCICMFELGKGGQSESHVGL